MLRHGSFYMLLVFVLIGCGFFHAMLGLASMRAVRFGINLTSPLLYLWNRDDGDK